MAGMNRYSSGRRKSNNSKGSMTRSRSSSNKKSSRKMTSLKAKPGRKPRGRLQAGGSGGTTHGMKNLRRGGYAFTREVSSGPLQGTVFGFGARVPRNLR